MFGEEIIMNINTRNKAFDPAIGGHDGSKIGPWISESMSIRKGKMPSEVRAKIKDKSH